MKYSSQYVGVSWSKRGHKWRASCAGQYLGSFTQEREAAIKYDEAARNLYGKAARVNFPKAGESQAMNGRSGGNKQKHGYAVRANTHHLYHVWLGIRSRCNSQGSRDYKNYGGRGITIHAEWANDFGAFFNYVEATLGPRPNRWHSLDRINNEGNYEPGNLRWATIQEQHANRRPHTKMVYWIKANYPEIYNKALQAVLEESS